MSISAAVIDIDKTLYDHPDYHAAGTCGEISEIAEILHQSYEDTAQTIATQRSILSLEWGRPATMTETVLSLRVTRAQWNELRCRVWQPEAWLKDDPNLCMMLLMLEERYGVVFATNSPRDIGIRVLQVLGIRTVMPGASVFGSDSFGISKPDPRFFTEIAKRLCLDPSRCISIGDREEADGVPALAAGYAGALIVPGSRDVLVEIVPQLFLGYKTEVNRG